MSNPERLASRRAVWDRQTVVPVHGKDIPLGTVRAIVRDLEPCLGKGWMR